MGRNGNVTVVDDLCGAGTGSDGIVMIPTSPTDYQPVSVTKLVIQMKPGIAQFTKNRGRAFSVEVSELEWRLT